MQKRKKASQFSFALVLCFRHRYQTLDLGLAGKGDFPSESAHVGSSTAETQLGEAEGQVRA